MLYRQGLKSSVPARRLLLFVVLQFALAPDAPSQSFEDDRRPLASTIVLPDFAPSAPAPGALLPPVLPAAEPSPFDVYSGRRFVLRGVRFTGNRVLGTAQLQQQVTSFLNRSIDINELQQLRDRISALYLSLGYVNSGARIPEQQIDDGILQVQLVEGVLSEVNVRNDGRFRDHFFIERLQHAAQPTLNVNRLERRLYQWQQDPRFKTISAELQPGERPGEARLQLQVQEAEPVTQSVDVNNFHTPAVGAEGVYYSWRHGNWDGGGEVLFLGLEKTEGLDGVNLLYELPVNAADDRLSYFAKLNRSDVIEGDFAALDIESRAATLGVSFKTGLQQDIDNIAYWFVNAEWRRSESYLLGDRFSFSPGPENGISRLSVLRTGSDMQWRSAQQVIAVRATLSVGLDMFAATRNDEGSPDAVFTSLLLQGQWAQRFDLLDSMLLARMDMQLSDSSLLGLEQFSIGGHDTVRGYRENTLVRDQGTVASLEWRVPFYRHHEQYTQHAVAVFYDAGYARNKRRNLFASATLNSIGLGFVGEVDRHWQYQLYWADALQDAFVVDGSDLQDEGLHFRLAYRW